MSETGHHVQARTLWHDFMSFYDVLCQDVLTQKFEMGHPGQYVWVLFMSYCTSAPSLHYNSLNFRLTIPTPVFLFWPRVCPDIKFYMTKCNKLFNDLLNTRSVICYKLQKHTKFNHKCTPTLNGQLHVNPAPCLKLIVFYMLSAERHQNIGPLLVTRHLCCKNMWRTDHMHVFFQQLCWYTIQIFERWSSSIELLNKDSLYNYSVNHLGIRLEESFIPKTH